MTVYTFSAAVDGLDISDTAALTRLYSEDIDIYPSSIDGDVRITFELEAVSGEDAVRRALQHVEATLPVRVTRVEEDMVLTADIADRLDVSRETVRLWATTGREEGFPRPRHILTGGKRLWTWASVYAWAVTRGKIDADEPQPIDDACVDWINGHRATHPHSALTPLCTEATTRAAAFTASHGGIVENWSEEESVLPHVGDFGARDGSVWTMASKPRPFAFSGGEK